MGPSDGMLSRDKLAEQNGVTTAVDDKLNKIDGGDNKRGRQENENKIQKTMWSTVKMNVYGIMIPVSSLVIVC